MSQSNRGAAFSIEPTGYAPGLPQYRACDLRYERHPRGKRLVIAETHTLEAAQAWIDAREGKRDWQTISDE